MLKSVDDLVRCISETPNASDGYYEDIIEIRNTMKEEVQSEMKETNQSIEKTSQSIEELKDLVLSLSQK